MSRKQKRRKRKPGKHGTSPLPEKLQIGLEEADILIRRNKLLEAVGVLEPLERRYSPRTEPLEMLASVYLQLGDFAKSQLSFERLSRLKPRDAEVVLGLAASYLSNIRPVLALRTFRRFVECWPQHPQADKARHTIGELGGHVEKLFVDLGLAGEEAEELAASHEEIQCLLDQGRYAQVREAAERLLARNPNFTPAQNNVSLSYFAEGRLQDAIASAERVLAVQPDNLHALSNLVHFFCVTGRWQEAAALKEPILSNRSQAADPWSKKLEALSYLGDDASIVALWPEATGQVDQDRVLKNPFCCHLAAVAFHRSGDESEAKRLWNQALQHHAGFSPARENLEDLKKPVGERDGPWAFPVDCWLPKTLIAELKTAFRTEARERSDAAAGTAFNFLAKHPELVAVVPVLLDRGDPYGRKFALRLALAAQTPEMLQTLEEFALGQRGPDQQRMEAANGVSRAGKWPSGPRRLWIQGEYREVLLLGFELHQEPKTGLTNREAQRLYLEATDALFQNNPAKAQPLLEKALALEPNSPVLFNNLAMSYELQGMTEKSGPMVQEMHRRFPDYWFGRITLARTHIQNGDFEQARAVLEPMLVARRLHFSEFAALCMAEIDLLLAQGQRAGARSWFEIWQQANPDHPQLEEYRNRVSAVSPLDWLLGRRQYRP